MYVYVCVCALVEDVRNLSVYSRQEMSRSVFAVVSDGFYRATLYCFLAKGFLLWCCGLLIDVGISLVIVASEILRCSFPAQIAINALVIDVDASFNIFGVFVFDLGHVFVSFRELELEL